MLAVTQQHRASRPFGLANVALYRAAASSGRCQPMGDLERIAIDDLTAVEEDEFFAIFEDI